MTIIIMLCCFLEMNPLQNIAKIIAGVDMHYLISIEMRTLYTSHCYTSAEVYGTTFHGVGKHLRWENFKCSVGN